MRSNLADELEEVVVGVKPAKSTKLVKLATEIPRLAFLFRSRSRSAQG